MKSVAILIFGTAITWPALFAALGALCAMLGTLALRLWRGRSPRGMGVFFLGAILFSLVLGRLLHWYSHPLLYDGFSAAMTRYAAGGFSLSGVFLGTLLAVLLCRGAGLVSDLPGLLDALAPAGALGIAVGRLGSLFDLSDRGKFMPVTPALRRLPFAAPSAAAGEWRFATFCVQALFCALLAAVMLWLFFRLPRRGLGDGHVFALFLAFYAAGQIVLDSTRYDADFFRFNGFVHVPQILCLAALVAVLVRYSVLSLRAGGFRPLLGALWAVFLAAVAAAGWMEYLVQRQPDRYALYYGVMSLCLALAAGVCAGLLRTLPPSGQSAMEMSKKMKSMLKEKKNTLSDDINSNQPSIKL